MRRLALGLLLLAACTKDPVAPTLDLTATGPDDLARVGDLATPRDLLLELASADALPPPDLFVATGFSLDTTPATMTFEPGQTLRLSVSIARGAGFADDVVLTFPDLPGALHATGTTLSGATLTAQLDVASDVVYAAQSGTFAVHAAGGGFDREATISYALQQAVDYTMTVTPAVTIPRTAGGVVTIAVSSNFAGLVVTPTIVATGLPAGVTVSPAPLVFDAATTAAPLQLQVDGTATIGGPTTITLTGTALPNQVGPTIRTATFELTIVEAPQFTLSATPTKIALSQGTGEDLTLMVTRDSGFADPLTTTLLAGPYGVSVVGGSFAGSDTQAIVTIHAAADAALLRPGLVTIATGVGTSRHTQLLEVTILPAPSPFLDPTFGQGGVAAYDTSYLGALGEGRALVVGEARVSLGDSFALAISADGSVQTGWGGSGVVGKPMGARPDYLHVGPAGDLYFASITTASPPVVEVSHLLPAPTVDPAFGTDGIVQLQLPGATSSLRGLTVNAAGEVFVLGAARDANSDFVIAKLTPTGELDTKFGTDGIARVDLGGEDTPHSLIFGDSDTLIAVGESIGGSGASEIALCRLTATGELDPAFDDDGLLLVANGADSYQTAPTAIRLADGALLVAGGGHIGVGANYVQLVRLSIDGVLDPGFGTGGFQTDPGLSSFETRSLVEDAKGRLVLGGSTRGLGNRHEFTLARYTSLGVRDPDFDSLGYFTIAGGSGFDEAINSVSIDPTSGAYWAFGSFGPRPIAARFLP